MPKLALTDAREIQAQLERYRPLDKAALPADLPGRLGATHYGGKYHRTSQPYLIEGAELLHGLGFQTIKLWLAPKLPGYAFNSTWDLAKDARLVEVVKHPYFRRVLEMPFSTVIFEIQPVKRGPGTRDGKAVDDFAADTDQIEELATHLLTAYGDQRITFILQHWEGDWMLRGQDKERWKPGSLPADVQARCDSFAAWLGARQRGVENARKKAGATSARVLHAAEVNRVLDCQKGVPTLVADVLPKVAVDLVSWSAYDGTNAKDPAVTTWHGIEIIRHFARPSPAGVRNHVYIGEVGIPESLHTPEQIERFWETTLGVFLAHNLPWIVQWELYCNEEKAGRTFTGKSMAADDMRGFWLVKPDGDLSVTGRIFARLLERHAGSAG